MVDIFSLGLTHGLMLIAIWRLLMREDLDQDPAQPARAATEVADIAFDRTATGQVPRLPHGLRLPASDQGGTAGHA